MPFRAGSSIKEGNPDEYYFNTDHHYTYAGAYESYKAIVERINTETGWQIPKMEKKDLIWKQLLNPFLGSSNRKLYALHPTEDKRAETKRSRYSPVGQ